MKTIIIYLLPLSAYFASFVAIAEFKKNEWEDEMNDQKVIELYTNGLSYSYNRFGFRCDLGKNGSSDFMLTFYSVNHVSTPNGKVTLKMRIDDGEPFKLNGRTYTNSYKSGIVRTDDLSLIEKLKSGNQVLIEFYSYNQLKQKGKFSLKGSSAALAETAGLCGLSSNLSGETVKRIKELERERDKKIDALRAEYEAKIKAIKGVK